LELHLRRRFWIIAGLSILLPLLVCTGIVVRFEYILRPRALREAGTIVYAPLRTDVSPDTILPRATGRENAARYYVAALNIYNVRRLPYLRKRGLDPIAKEPRIGLPELNFLMHGAHQEICDFSAGGPGQQRLAVRNLPGKKPWPFVVAVDPYAARPYVAPMRSMAQAALNWGKEKERQRQPFAAALAYQTVIRLGEHLRQKPGSLMDMELSIEIERRGLHYLESWYARNEQVPAFAGMTRPRANAGAAAKRRACWRYGDSLSRLEAAERRKFAQLYNPEAAIRVLREDRDRLWRIEAAAALDTTLHMGHPGWLEARVIRRALDDARHDPDAHVRAALALLARMSGNKR
jgi:hypothetical protein